jgi:hypothetical protein
VPSTRRKASATSTTASPATEALTTKAANVVKGASMAKRTDGKKEFSVSSAQRLNGEDVHSVATAGRQFRMSPAEIEKRISLNEQRVGAVIAILGTGSKPP